MSYFKKEYFDPQNYASVCSPQDDLHHPKHTEEKSRQSHIHFIQAKHTGACYSMGGATYYVSPSSSHRSVDMDVEGME